jgi:tetratricopeptide (TPR) repeat protein
MDAPPPDDSTLKPAPVRLPWWSFVALAVFLVALTAVFYARPIYHAFMDWRAGSAAADVTQAMDAGDREKAMALGGEVFRQYPDSPPVLRVLARLLAEMAGDYSTSTSLLKRLITKGAATEDDKIMLAEYLAKAGDLVGAEAAIVALPAAVQSSRRVLEAKASIASFLGDTAKATDLLRQALKAEPDNPECQLKLAMLEDVDGFATQQITPAMQRIWKLAERKDKTGLSAIRYITTSASLTATDVPRLLELVTGHPLAKDDARYAVLTAHHRLRPLDTDKMVEQELQRQQGRGITDLSDFLRWLVVTGHTKKIQTILPMEQILKDSRSMLVYIDALSAGGEWNTLIELMHSQRLPISAATRNLVLGQSHGRLDSSQSDTAAQFLREAIASAGQKEVTILGRAGEAAESLGLTEVAREAYRRILTTQPERRIELLERLLALYRRERDELGTIETLKELILARPGFQPYADDLNYTRLITGLELELAETDLRESQKNPVFHGVSLPLMRAMAARRFTHDESWKKHLDAIKSPESLTPGMRAVLAGYLADSGESDRAFRLAETILGTLYKGRLVGDKRALLLPEELKLLEAAIR